MRIAIDILHPAHVHFFKYFIWEMQKNGHEILVTARDKDITLFLLDNYKIDYKLISRMKQGKINLLSEFITRTIKYFFICRKFKPNMLLGIMGPTISVVGKLLNIPAYIFYDTEHAKITNSFAYKLATKIITPDCYLGDLGSKHIRYPGYHELAYLHPNWFKPNPEVLKEIGLKEGDPFFIVRFVSWGASHDIGHKGLSLEEKRNLIEILKDKGRIIITSENNLPEEFEQYRMNVCPTKMHDLLYYATLLYGESATMSSECCVLGTHSIYIDFAGRGYTDEQEKKYDLVYNFKTDNKSIKDSFDKLRELLDIENLKVIGSRKRERLLNDRIDVTEYMLSTINDFINYE